MYHDGCISMCKNTTFLYNSANSPKIKECNPCFYQNSRKITLVLPKLSMHCLSLKIGCDFP